MMIYIAIALFLCAAIFGIILANAILRGQPTPKPVVFIHGLLAAAGLAMVVLYAVKNAENKPMTSLILLIIGALGGFVLFARDMQKKPGPFMLVVIHALFGVSGVLGLLLFVMK